MNPHPYCNVVTGACCDECAQAEHEHAIETGQTVVPTPTGVSYNLRDEFPYNLTDEQRQQFFYPWHAPYYRFRHPRWRRVWLYGMWRYVPWWWMGGSWGDSALPVHWEWMTPVQVGQGLADFPLALTPQNQQFTTPVVQLTPISYQAFGYPRRSYAPQVAQPPSNLCVRVMRCLADIPSPMRALTATLLEGGGLNSATLSDVVKVLYSGGQYNAASCLNALLTNEFGQAWN